MNKLAVLVALAAGLSVTLALVTGNASRREQEKAGERRFERLGCGNCHGAQAGARGPALTGLLGSQVTLQGGVTVQADEEYVRESIMNPGAEVLAGYKLIMPVYEGQIDEQGLRQLVAYIRSLRPPAEPESPTAGRENRR